MRSALVLALASCVLQGCESFGDAPAAAADAGRIPDGSALADGATGEDAAPPDAATPDAAPDPTLIAHWTMNDTAGKSVTESVAGRDGLISGNGTFTPGKIGNAFSTAGGTSHIAVGNNAGLAVTTTFTIAMWLSLSPSTSDSYFYAHGYQFSMKLNGRRPQLYVADHYVNVSTSIPPDEWHHVAASFDSGVVKIYVDGVDAGQDESNASVATAPPLSGAIKIGTSNGGGNPAIGLIDDVRLWNRALAAKEIKALVQ